MTNDALRTILPVAGWGDDRAREVEITGGTDPILPTPFRIGETAAATLAAVGLAVSDLWALRTGRHQDVAVDTRQATASRPNSPSSRRTTGASPRARSLKVARTSPIRRRLSGWASRVVSEESGMTRLTHHLRTQALTPPIQVSITLVSRNALASI